MLKPKIQFDMLKLESEQIPKRVGNDGDDPHIRHLKEMHARDPEKAQLFFEKMHGRLSKKPGFEWLDRVRKPDPPKPK